MQRTERGRLRILDDRRRQVDDVNGVSRVQLNGISLQNYANADGIATFVDQLLYQGVAQSQITMLVYYTGQLSLVTHKIETTAKIERQVMDPQRG